MPSSFLREIPGALVVTRSTTKLRGSGRSPEGELSRGRGTAFGDDEGPSLSPSARRPGSPIPRFTSPRPASDEDESQDTPRFVAGERVQHARFGGGTIADLAGSGRDAKVTIDFDDETVGRKRLVVAHAGLTRGVD